MRSIEPTPPGIGIVRRETDEPPTAHDHFHGWGEALDQALRNIGRAPGNYRVDVALSATVQISNPGMIVEYIVTLT
jgi:hypothetical protein